MGLESRIQREKDRRKKHKQPNRKVVKEYEQEIHRGENLMVNNYVKRCSTTLVNGKKIKIDIISHTPDCKT